MLTETMRGASTVQRTTIGLLEYVCSQPGYNIYVQFIDNHYYITTHLAPLYAACSN
jgi:hypothetical protein